MINSYIIFCKTNSKKYRLIHMGYQVWINKSLSQNIKRWYNKFYWWRLMNMSHSKWLCLETYYIYQFTYKLFQPFHFIINQTYLKYGKFILPNKIAWYYNNNQTDQTQRLQSTMPYSPGCSVLHWVHLFLYIYDEYLYLFRNISRVMTYYMIFNYSDFLRVH